MVLGALCLAALIVMALPPDLPPPSKNYTFAPMINMDMVSANSSHQGSSLVYNEEQVNSYFASNLRRRTAPPGQGYFPLRRVLVRVRRRRCEINTERQLLGFSIYSGSAYRVKSTTARSSAPLPSGYIGRMPIHPAVMKYADISCKGVGLTGARASTLSPSSPASNSIPQSVTLVAAR